MKIENTCWELDERTETWSAYFGALKHLFGYVTPMGNGRWRWCIDNLSLLPLTKRADDDYNTVAEDEVLSAYKGMQNVEIVLRAIKPGNGHFVCHCREPQCSAGASVASDDGFFYCTSHAPAKESET